MIHKLLSWNWENISKSWPKFRPKIRTNWIFNEKLHRIRKKPHRTIFRFFSRYYDAEEVIHQHISRNWENIPKSGPKFSPKIMKSCLFNEKLHRIRKNPRRTIFGFFVRYYDAEEVIHQHISRNWENISKSWPKFRPKIMTNWIFNEKVHRIRKTSQDRFSLYRMILRCWKSDS